MLPVTFVPENEDIIVWHNYVVYNPGTIASPGQAKSDLQIVYDLANMLGVMSKMAPGRSGDYQTDLQYWLAHAFSTISPSTSLALNAQPTTLAQFKSIGYLEYATPDLPALIGGLQNFSTSPTKYPLNTPSGLIEIYSQEIAAFWGTNNPTAPAIPKYIPSPENRLAPLATKYPLEFNTNHGRYSEHEQWHQIAWYRDEDYVMLNGYMALWMNPQDAAARGIKHGDPVRVFNDRGQTLYAAHVTERMKPGFTMGWDGGNWKPMQPGVTGSLDMGGSCNILTPITQNEPICDGMIQAGLVEVEKYGGA